MRDRMRIKLIVVLLMVLLLTLSLNKVPAPETTGFHIIKVIPEDKTQNVYWETEIKVKFSHDVNMSTVNNESFKINPSVVGIFSYNNETFTVTFTPSDYFLANDYIINVTKSIKDVNGESLPYDYNWQFEVRYNPMSKIEDFYCEKNSIFIEPGSHSVFEVVVKSSVCGSGEFQLSIYNLPEGWKGWFSEPKFYLESDRTKRILLTVTAPENAEPFSQIKFFISVCYNNYSFSILDN